MCDKKFAKGDDIVVCPDCGTPYHRACYKENGACLHAEQHSSGYEYTPPKSEPKDNRCTNCGMDNPQNNLFCEKCGSSLREIDKLAKEQLKDDTSNKIPFNDVPPEPNHNPLASPMSDFMRMAPIEKEYDGIASSDWIRYIGASAPYYLMQFSRMDSSPSKKKTTFCWSALFFTPFYFAYRKMWSWMMLSVLGSIVVSIPAFILMLHDLGYSTGINTGTAMFSTVAFLCSLLSWGMNIFFALFAFYLFRQHGIKKIHALKEKKYDERTYFEKLEKVGNPGILGIILLFVAIFAASYLFVLLVGPEAIMTLYSLYL